MIERSSATGAMSSKTSKTSTNTSSAQFSSAQGSSAAAIKKTTKVKTRADKPDEGILTTEKLEAPRRPKALSETDKPPQIPTIRLPEDG